MIKAGAPEKTQIRIHASKIQKILNDHKEVGTSTIKGIPKVLDDPMVALRSKSIDSRVIVFGELYTKNEKPALIVLELNPTKNREKEMDLIMVASVYSRKDLQNLINSSEILYINEDEEKIQSWLKVNRLQLPLPSPKSVSRQSIALEGAEDNTEQKKDSLNESDEAYMKAVESGDMETAQRMVDEAAERAMPDSILREGMVADNGEREYGKLIKMYHGSGAKGLTNTKKWVCQKCKTLWMF